MTIKHNLKQLSLHKSIGKILAVLSLLALYHCANPVMPVGGAKDINAPKADSLISSKSMVLNFTKRPIKFKFNEWVILDNVQTQLVVSPPLSFPPKVTLKGKTVEFNFSEKEVLRPNTTYSIQFGNSVKDLTEGNVVKNLRYVFSTGDEIDKAEVYGSVRNAYKQEYTPEASILLYTSLSDTVIYKSKPDYFAKTAKDGTYSIPNVRAGTYQLYALLDENANYHYDLDTELVGIADSLIVVSKDQSRNTGSILISKERKPAKLLERKLNQPGVVSLFFSADPKDLKYTIEDVGQKYIVEKELDSLKIWYTIPSPKDWKIYFESGLKKDTIKVKSIIPQGKTARKLTPVSLKRGLGSTSITPSETFQLDFSNPIITIDSSRIIVLSDTIVQKNISLNVETDKPRRLSFHAKWKEEKAYKIKMLPGAITDLYSNVNDTISWNVRVLSPKELGNISMHLTNMSVKKHYILELYTSQSNLVSRYFIDGVTKWDKKLPNLVAGQYEILIIEDLNQNGRWDPVDLTTKRQAEPLYRKKTEPLRPNWELDVNLSL